MIAQKEPAHSIVSTACCIKFLVIYTQGKKKPVEMILQIQADVSKSH